MGAEPPPAGLPERLNPTMEYGELLPRLAADTVAKYHRRGPGTRAHKSVSAAGRLTHGPVPGI